MDATTELKSSRESISKEDLKRQVAQSTYVDGHMMLTCGTSSCGAYSWVRMLDGQWWLIMNTI